MLQIGIAGTPRDLIARLEGLAARGIQHLSFGPPLGPDPSAGWLRRLGARSSRISAPTTTR